MFRRLPPPRDLDPFVTPAEEEDALGHLKAQAKTYEPCPTCHWRPDLCGCPKEIDHER